MPLLLEDISFALPPQKEPPRIGRATGNTSYILKTKQLLSESLANCSGDITLRLQDPDIVRKKQIIENYAVRGSVYVSPLFP